MSSGRAAVLAGVRRSLAAAKLPDVAPLPALPAAPPAGEAALVARFAAELAAVGGEFVAPESDAAARQVVVDLVREAGGGPILTWTEDELALPGLGEALGAVGVVREGAHLPVAAEARRVAAQALDRPLVGITGALAGLADTGSIVLLSGPGRPAVTSLAPPLHIALLSRQAIVPDLRAFLATRDPRDLTAWRNLVFITGPSRTADIEMILTRGVHGPARLVVVAI